MKIKLKDSINSELIAVGLRPGDEISSNDVNKTTGAVQFTRWQNGSSYNCVVWPEDYEVIQKDSATEVRDPELPQVPNKIILSIPEVVNALDAMHWCICSLSR